MDAAGDDKAPEIAYSNEASKKIFRARKTMAASCRQQMASLSKIKNMTKMENSVNELLIAPTEEAVQREDSMCETNFIAQDDYVKITPAESCASNGLPLSTEVAHDDSGLDSGCSYKSTEEQTNMINENTSSAAASPVPLSPIENYVSGNTEEHQQSDLSPISSVKESNMLISDATKDCSQMNIYSNCSESTALKTIDKDSDLKMKSTVGLVTPMDVLYGESSSAASPCQESNTSNMIGTSNTVEPDFSMDRVAISASSEVSQGGNSAAGNCKRKRTFSGDEEDSKRAKTSNKNLLDEIHNMIEKRIQTVFKESFDQRMQDLSQQISLIQSKGLHADVIEVHVRRIRRLGKRIKYALDVQSELGSVSCKSQPVSASCDEPSQTQPPNITSTYLAPAALAHTGNSSAQNLGKDSANLVVLSDNEPEHPSNPAKDQKIRNSKSPPRKVDSEAIRKILESIKEHRKKNISSRVPENGKTIIDLTDDEEQKSDKDLKRNESISSSPMSVPVQDKGNCPQKMEHKEEKSALHKNERPCDVNDRTCSVPKSTQTLKAIDAGTSIQIPNSDPCMLKPPQKPELRLAQVQNPKGIALSWNITQVDPSCAPAKVYCLYVNQENLNSAKKLWKKIGEIKALPLPMACTLTQFVDDATYSFALRAKDSFGRFGPLCDIQSTTLKSLTTLKKI